VIAILALLLAAPAVVPAPDPSAGVDVVEHLGEKIPEGLVFTDSAGASRGLDELFGRDRPVVLTMAYHRCPGFCEEILQSVTAALRRSGLVLGDDYYAATVSIDPNEKPADSRDARARYVQALGAADDAPWRFLTGDPGSISELAEAVGFRYRYDADSGLYDHPSAVFVIAPDRTISRYFYGIGIDPKDLRLALVEAAGGKVGTSLDRVILTCFRYDPARRRYAFYVKGFLRTGGMIVFAALALLLGTLWRKELARP
jgi:protein SCO1/2